MPIALAAPSPSHGVPKRPGNDPADLPWRNVVPEVHDAARMADVGVPFVRAAKISIDAEEVEATLEVLGLLADALVRCLEGRP